MTQRFEAITPVPLGPHPGAPLIQRAGRVLRITLNRPAEHNRIDPADVDAMLALLERIREDAQPPCALVITGTGEKSFSSGYTLQAIVEELDSRFERMLDALETLPFPTIAAFNGSVYGGATDLALCCDIRIGVPGMRMFMPAAKFGLHYYPGGLRRYVERLGLAAASKLMLTAMTIETDEMLRIGFLTEVVEREALAGRVETYLEHIERNAPVVVAQMKQHLLALARVRAEGPGAVALDASLASAYRQSVGSDELRGRLAALLAR